MTADIAKVSLAGDAEPELLIAQPLLGQVSWLRGCGDGDCDVTSIDRLGQPVRTALLDAEGDGDTDILVADIGSIKATNERVGRVLLLVNPGDNAFTRRMLLADVGRVSCAEPGDFDGDGDMDVLVCEFGLDDGAVSWLQRNANNTYTRHVIKDGAGAVEAVPHDMDGDGKLDVVVSMSQDFQQIVLFRNLGGGRFKQRVLWQAPGDFGLVGLEATDLDRDGDLDFVVSGGDYFDPTFSFDEQGVWWLENRGRLRFKPHRIARLIGPHVTRSVDMDGDCDLDLAVATMRLESILPKEALEEPALWWLENDGTQHFTPHEVRHGPAHTIALEIADFGTGPSWIVGSFTFGVARKHDARLAALWAR